MSTLFGDVLKDPYAVASCHATGASSSRQKVSVHYKFLVDQAEHDCRFVLFGEEILRRGSRLRLFVFVITFDMENSVVVQYAA